MRSQVTQVRGGRTLRPRAWLESAVNATSTVAASNSASNSSAMSADDTGGLLTTIRSRLDDLLGTDEAAASGAVPANASATPLLDSIAGVAGPLSCCARG